VVAYIVFGRVVVGLISADWQGVNTVASTQNKIPAKMQVFTLNIILTIILEHHPTLL
jgi:hypothetical protein